MRLELKVPRMMCEGCVGTIKNTLKNIDGLESYDVILDNKTVVIEPGQLKDSYIRQVLAEAGYPVSD